MSHGRGFSAPDYVPGPGQIDALLEFLPIFRDPDFEPAAFEKTESGVMSSSVWSIELRKFHQAVYDNGFIYPFDWGSWQEKADQLLEESELLMSADLQTIRMLLTTHVRKERFCEGYLPMMVRCGHIAVLLERLKVIRAGCS